MTFLPDLPSVKTIVDARTAPALNKANDVQQALGNLTVAGLSSKARALGPQLAGGSRWMPHDDNPDPARPWEQVPAQGGGSWRREVDSRHVVYGSWLGLDTTGATDASAGINSVTNNAYMPRVVLVLDPGEYRLNGTVNVGRTAALWGCEQAPGTCVLKPTFTDGSPAVRNPFFTDAYVGNASDSLFRTWLRDIEIKGAGGEPGSRQNAVGVELANCTQRMENVRISGLRKGVYFSPYNNYLQQIDRCTISGCDIGLEFPAATGGNSNSGENLSITNSFIIGHGTAIAMQDGWSLRVSNTSVDYNTHNIQFVSNNASALPQINFNDCHIEWKSDQPFLQNNYGNGGGHVHVKGGVFLNLKVDGTGSWGIEKAHLIDGGCGPRHSVVLDYVNIGAIASATWATSQVDPANFTVPLEYQNTSSIEETFYITVTHKPTASVQSYAELRAGQVTLSAIGTTARPAGTPHNHSEVLMVRVPPFQRFGLVGENVTVTFKRQGDT